MTTFIPKLLFIYTIFLQVYVNLINSSCALNFTMNTIYKPVIFMKSTNFLTLYIIYRTSNFKYVYCIHTLHAFLFYSYLNYIVLELLNH
jgi:hypothetical protein